MNTASSRTALFASLAATALFVSGCQSTQESGQSFGQAPVAGALPPTKETQAAMTPQKAVAELKAGNERFTSGHPLVRDPLAAAKATASGQYPFAVVLSCLDSRVPIELVLDQGIGDVFSARVAGNVLEEDILGSMEFGCKAAGAKLIAVIGHSNCGAVKGAIDNVEMGNLTALLSRIKPAVDQVPGDSASRSSQNLEYVDKVAEANVHLIMRQIRERSPVLREMLDQGKIALVGGMYDLSTSRIHFFE
jgi:carbonic anhydrase